MTTPEQLLKMPNDDAIRINIDNRGDRYTVYATYYWYGAWGDPANVNTGVAYTSHGHLRRLFGIGDSVETELKKATCRAVADLKQKWKSRLREEIQRREYQRICDEQAAKCGDRE